MGRPCFVLTENDRKVVERMAEVGCRHGDIAQLLGIAAGTMRRYFRTELDRAAINGNRKVLQSLYKMASSGENTTASIFWAKTRCGMKETGEREDVGAPPYLLVTTDAC